MLSRSSKVLFRNSISVRIGYIQFFSSAVPAAVESAAGTPVKKQIVDNGRKRHSKTLKVGVININEAFDIMKEHMWANFNETVEAIVMLNVDPRKPNQSIRGVASLPHGVGKSVSVAVFARDADAQAAIDAGADFVGAEDLIARVQSGDIPFQRAIATPDLMPMLSKIGKVFTLSSSISVVSLH